MTETKRPPLKKIRYDRIAPRILDLACGAFGIRLELDMELADLSLRPHYYDDFLSVVSKVLLRDSDGCFLSKRLNHLFNTDALRHMDTIGEYARWFVSQWNNEAAYEKAHGVQQ